MGGSFGTGTFKFGQDAQVWEDSEPRSCPAGGTSQPGSRDSLIRRLGKQLMTVSDVTGSERSGKKACYPTSCLVKKANL